MAKAIGLISGGLDSLLAARVLLDQKIRLLGVCFQTPFFGAEKAKQAAARLGIPLMVQDITEEHLRIVKKPAHGYGSAMNPCIDCHALMIQKAGERMKAEGFDFVFTGEVLNERPMSQTRHSLALVARLSGYSDFLLRPLSARLLPETRMEREGLVNRQGLLDLQGRSRKRQLALAKAYGLAEFPNPAGGCLLTDRGFSARLRELLKRGDFDLRDLWLLQVGRHFRLGPVKVIVGRNEEENRRIRNYAREGDILLSAEHFPGPLALVCGEAPDEILEQAAAICAALADPPGKGRSDEIWVLGGRGGRIRPPRLSREEMEKFRI
ncbi:MAG: tRNA 4-thiouridine(8) synthase ThiI [candidate division NC10 bacterium]|nr:tRNA 4-thiouridine(8) synthase ThiI [candidate division NC10 bacterium]